MIENTGIAESSLLWAETPDGAVSKAWLVWGLEQALQGPRPGAGGLDPVQIAFLARPRPAAQRLPGAN